MTLEEIRGFASEDLEVKLDNATDELFKLRYAAAAESLENAKSVRDVRKRIARIKTVLRERELAAAAAGSEK